MSTPKGSPKSSNGEEAPFSSSKVFVDTQMDISKALKNLVVQKMDSKMPIRLKDTESSSVQKLFEEYDLYKKEGEERLRAFC